MKEKVFAIPETLLLNAITLLGDAIHPTRPARDVVTVIRELSNLATQGVAKPSAIYPMPKEQED